MFLQIVFRMIDNEMSNSVTDLQTSVEIQRQLTRRQRRILKSTSTNLAPRHELANRATCLTWRQQHDLIADLYDSIHGWRSPEEINPRSAFRPLQPKPGRPRSRARLRCVRMEQKNWAKRYRQVREIEVMSSKSHKKLRKWFKREDVRQCGKLENSAN